MIHKKYGVLLLKIVVIRDGKKIFEIKNDQTYDDMMV
jgi:hypothetical protein